MDFVKEVAKNANKETMIPLLCGVATSGVIKSVKMNTGLQLKPDQAKLLAKSLSSNTTLVT